MAFLATIAAGLASRKFPGLLPAFLGKYPGDALWSLMVFFGVGAMFPTAAGVRVATTALGLAYAVEALKLWQAPWLVQVRHTAIGHLVFGHVFSWQNLVAYAVGVLVGLALESFFLRQKA